MKNFDRLCNICIPYQSKGRVWGQTKLQVDAFFRSVVDKKPRAMTYLFQ